MMMMMEVTLFTLTILAIIDRGYAGDRELRKRDRNVYEPHSSAPLQLSAENRTLLDVYHETDPFMKQHETRMSEKLNDPKQKNLRQRAQWLIGNLCIVWEQTTGLNVEATDQLLTKISSIIKTDGTDAEVRMRDKLLEVRPDFRGIDPEIIRSVIHDWYRSIRRATYNEGQIRSKEELADLLYTYHVVHFGEGTIHNRLTEKWQQFHPNSSNYSKIALLKKAVNLTHAHSQFSPEDMERAKERYEKVFGTESTEAVKLDKRGMTEEERTQMREEQADLLYTYHQVQFEEGSVHDRLAKKWNQFRPHSTYSNKTTLFRKAYNLSNTQPKFSPEEMEKARIRYESVFGAGSGKAFMNLRRRRIHWNEGQEIDLMYLLNMYRRKEISRETFDTFWQVLHPEIDFAKRRDLYNKFESLKRKNFKLTPEMEAAVRTKLQAALKQKEQNYQEAMPIRIGESLASQSSHRQKLQQQPSARMTQSPPPRINLELTLGRQHDLETPMDLVTVQHSPTPRPHPPSYHYSNRTYDPYTVNPFYEHGSSSHSHLNPYITNPHYVYDGSSHSHYDPHTVNPLYQHDNSSHPHEKPHQ